MVLEDQEVVLEDQEVVLDNQWKGLVEEVVVEEGKIPVEEEESQVNTLNFLTRRNWSIIGWLKISAEVWIQALRLGLPVQEDCSPGLVDSTWKLLELEDLHWIVQMARWTRSSSKKEREN